MIAQRPRLYAAACTLVCPSCCSVLVAALVALPDDLVTSLLVLALLPAPFTFELVAPLLALPATVNERRAVLRRLVNMGLLGHNRSLQQYSVHKLVRDAARLLMMNLGVFWGAAQHSTFSLH